MNDKTTTKRPVGKVSFAKWQDIRAAEESGQSVGEIAARLHLSEKTVSDVISYKREAANAR
jgi:DNA-binding NarL/FixJ family response regulator